MYFDIINTQIFIILQRQTIESSLNTFRGLDKVQYQVQIQEVIPKSFKARLNALVNTIRNTIKIYNSKKSIKDSRFEINSKQFDEFNENVDLEKIDNKRIENFLEKLIAQNEIFTEKLESYLNHTIREDESYDLRVQLIEERIREKKVIINLNCK